MENYLLLYHSFDYHPFIELIIHLKLFGYPELFIQ